MQKIKLVADSACDMPKQEAEQYGIQILPIPLTFQNKGYLEGVDFTNQQFYDLLLSSDEIPVTSHITAVEFSGVYRQAFDEGYTDVILVTIASEGSNMYNAARLGKDMFYEENPEAKDMNVYVIDSKAYTYTYGYALVEAAKMAREERSPEYVVSYLQDYFQRAEIYFSVFSLDHVKKSGRVSCAAAFVGELLGLKPIIKFIDGIATITTKVRGDKAVVPKLVSEACAHMTKGTPYIVMQGCVEGSGAELARQMEAAVGYPPVGIYQVGASIALNSGPKVVAVVVQGKKRS